jgi:hypothetical protein
MSLAKNTNYQIIDILNDDATLNEKRRYWLAKTVSPPVKK